MLGVYNQIIRKTEKNDRIIKVMNKKQENLPDANQKRHQKISFIKSAIRIIGYCFLPFSLEIAAIVLILSEIIGIVEELV